MKTRLAVCSTMRVLLHEMHERQQILREGGASFTFSSARGEIVSGGTRTEFLLAQGVVEGRLRGMRIDGYEMIAAHLLRRGFPWLAMRDELQAAMR